MVAVYSNIVRYQRGAKKNPVFGLRFLGRKLAWVRQTLATESRQVGGKSRQRERVYALQKRRAQERVQRLYLFLYRRDLLGGYEFPLSVFNALRNTAPVNSETTTHDAKLFVAEQ